MRLKEFKYFTANYPDYNVDPALCESLLPSWDKMGFAWEDLREAMEVLTQSPKARTNVPA